MKRVRGLDSIRFISALWVFLSHAATPALYDPFLHGSLASLALRGVFNNLWNGPAAVIIFFVISGFCIHFPFAAPQRNPALGVFYARRFIRLLVPVAVAIPLGRLVHVGLVFYNGPVLWSLLAEMLYYICYPLLRWARFRLGGWRWLLAGSFVVALAVILTNPHAGDYPSYGPALNWLLGLPCWLLGCVLAERVLAKEIPVPSAREISAWRAGIFGAAWLCSVIRFHSPLGFPWTLDLFAIPAALWLYREIGYRKAAAPSRILEWAGTWSYSLYLLHVPAMAAFTLFFLRPVSGISLAAMVLFVLAACYLFYIVVEYPAHLLARRVAKMLESGRGEPPAVILPSSPPA